MAIPGFHFQSIHRVRDQSGYDDLIVEPLCCEPRHTGIQLSPLRSEITCPACLSLLMRIKESVHA